MALRNKVQDDLPQFKEVCSSCAGSGKVCMKCGASAEDPANHDCEEFDPVRCPECNGGGL